MFHVPEPTEPPNGNQLAQKEERSNDSPIWDAVISLGLGFCAEALLLFGSFFQEEHLIGKLCAAVQFPVRSLVLRLIGPPTGDSWPASHMCSEFGTSWLLYAIVIYALLRRFTGRHSS